MTTSRRYWYVAPVADGCCPRICCLGGRWHRHRLVAGVQCSCVVSTTILLSSAKYDDDADNDDGKVSSTGSGLAVASGKDGRDRKLQYTGIVKPA